MINSEGDRHLLEIVYGLPPEVLESIDNTYVPKDIKKYLAIQLNWLAEEKWLVGAKTGHDPSLDEQIEDIEHERLTRRFRVYYALSHPEEVIRRAEVSDTQAPQVPRLKPEHERMINSEGDRHLLEIVYGLPPEVLESIDSTYVPKDIKKYLAIQRRWFEEEKWLVGAKAGHDPSLYEQLEDIERERLTRRFRVYYALTHPEEVKRKAEVPD